MLPLYGLFSQFLLCVIIIFIINYVVQNLRYYRLAAKIPGPAMLTLPLIRDPLTLLRNKLNALRTMHEYHNKYGDLFRVYLPQMCVVLTKPEHIEKYCTSPDLGAKSEQYAALSEIMGHTSLLTSSGDDFKQSRKVFYKTFVGQDFKYVIDALYDGVADLTNNFDKHVGGSWFPAGDYLIQIALANILRGSFKLDPADFPRGFELIKKTDYFLKHLMIKSWTPVLKYDLIFDMTPAGRQIRSIVDEFWNMIQNKLKDREIEFADVIAEKNGQMPNQVAYTIFKQRKESPELRVHDMATLILTAADTTSLTIGHILHMLGMHPEVQQKVFDEDVRIQIELAGRPMIETDIKSYEYTSRVVKETLRLNPIVPFIGRLAEKDITIDKYTIPKGANVMVFLTALHRNPNIYPDPLRFDPDRFLPENVEKLKKFEFLPFSHGQRVCPGARYAMLSTVFMISSIIRRYKVFSKYKSVEEWDSNLRGTMTLNDINHFPIRLEARS